MNSYATVEGLKERLSISVTTYDDILEEMLEHASRMIDQETHRHFYLKKGSLFADSGSAGTVNLPDDCISISAFKADSELDGTFDGESWTEGTDYYLWPENSFPKLRAMMTTWGNYSLPEMRRRYLLITGVWGYAESADPWEASGITGTVADASGTTLTLSAEGTIKRGQTIQIGEEWMYVSAVSSDGSNTATVLRGANGSTAAAHTAAAISIRTFPELVTMAAMMFATRMYRQMGAEEMQMEQVKGYMYQRFNADNLERRDRRMILGYRKWGIG